MLFTQRLELIEGTVELLRAAIRSLPGAEPHDHSLGEQLHARIPATWPPEHLDQQAIEWTIRHLEGPATRGTAGNYYVILREGVNRTLVGLCGYHTLVEGTAQIGYGIVSEYHRRGIASEATRAMIAELRKRPTVKRIIALTYPDHVASLGVMKKCGMRFVGAGSEEGTVEYELAL